MQWYYVENGTRLGPLEEGDFQTLCASGQITEETLVWHADLADWMPYGAVPQANRAEAMAVEEQQRCAECGQDFPAEELIFFKEAAVCASCKKVFFQRFFQGDLASISLPYASVNKRLIAKFFDWMLMGAVILVPYSIVSLISGNDNHVITAILAFSINISSIFLTLGYSTFFIARYGATLGKQAMGIKVIMPDGEGISYARALGRAAGEIVSGILYLGYLIACFDKERRALHDLFCDTRVINV